jgi:transposase
MNSIRLPSEEEIKIAYDQGLSAIVVLMQERFFALVERIEKLEDQLAKNSGNSGKPPSSDGYEKPAPKSRRKRSGKKSGGQVGHPGHTLKAVAQPDKIEVYPVTNCAHCLRSLKREETLWVEKRQVFDLPEIQFEVTEHQAEVKTCPQCQQITKGQFSLGVSQATQYGKKIKAQMAYFHEYQLLPLKRAKEMFQELYGQTIAEGTILAACEEIAEQVQAANEEIKEHLTYKTSVEHFDETGLRIENALYWLHVASTDLLTYYGFHKKRGQEGMDAVGILPNFSGRAIHDGLPVYLRYLNCQHGLCNVHHLRSLDFLEERYPQKWVTELKELLLEIKTTVDEAKERLKTRLSLKIIGQFTARYDALLRKGLRVNPPLKKMEGPAKRGRPKQSFARNLLSRLSEQKEAVLAFMHDFDVPFDNNQAERDIRMMKVRQKISGCFRSQRGAEIFCAVRGYISTAHKNHRPILNVLYSAFDGQPFIPAFVLQPR